MDKSSSNNINFDTSTAFSNVSSSVNKINYIPYIILAVVILVLCLIGYHYYNKKEQETQQVNKNLIAILRERSGKTTIKESVNSTQQKKITPAIIEFYKELGKKLCGQDWSYGPPDYKEKKLNIEIKETNENIDRTTNKVNINDSNALIPISILNSSLEDNDKKGLIAAFVLANLPNIFKLIEVKDNKGEINLDKTLVKISGKIPLGFEYNENGINLLSFQNSLYKLALNTFSYDYCIQKNMSYIDKQNLSSEEKDKELKEANKNCQINQNRLDKFKKINICNFIIEPKPTIDFYREAGKKLCGQSWNNGVPKYKIKDFLKVIGRPEDQYKDIDDTFLSTIDSDRDNLIIPLIMNSSLSDVEKKDLLLKFLTQIDSDSFNLVDNGTKISLPENINEKIFGKDKILPIEVFKTKLFNYLTQESSNIINKEKECIDFMNTQNDDIKQRDLPLCSEQANIIRQETPSNICPILIV